MKKEMVLIDGHGLAFRGFYALPDTLAASDGTPTNAILGFTNMLVKYLDEWQPEGVGLFFDPKGPTQRREMFNDYKRNRKPTPPDFKKQMPLIIDICRAMGIPVFIRDGVEADDYIVATAKKAAAEGWRVKILSADKDLFQAIDDDITVVRPGKGITEFTEYDEAHFRKTYEFAPVLMADYLALLGDAVDNIPGVRGIGEKSAKDMVSKYGSLERIYEHLDEMQRSRREKMEEGRELAFSSRELVIPQETESVPLSELRIGNPDEEVLKPLLQRLSLRKLSERMGYSSVRAPGSEKSASPAHKRYHVVLLPEEAHAPFSASFEGELKQIAFEEALAVRELALARTSAGLFLATKAGEAAPFDTADAGQAAQWAKWCETGTLTLYGLRALLAGYDLAVPALDRVRDVEVMHYLLHPDRSGKNIEKTIGYEMLDGPEQGVELFALDDFFMPDVERLGLERLMCELDVPLAPALAKLQRNGITVDRPALQALEQELELELAETEAAITRMAGETINLNSPKQVGFLLFEQLNLPPIKKTKTGYSTDVSVLEELAKLPEPLCDVPKKILLFREQSKLLSGFVQPFLKMTEENARVHSSFDHLATGTGRLASYDPNVQNIPVFGTGATRFRSCFVPGEGRTFVAADYSQIELRVLAHLCREPKLVDAFVTGCDVHMETASWVFDLPPQDITPEQRRFAKVVNFGLLYGMSAFGLAQRLGINRFQAATMVDKYFSVFPGVRAYLDESMMEAKENGYTKSIFGRIRPLREVATTDGRGNTAIDRVAVNTPIQSAASDIAKIALLRFSEIAEKEFKEAYPVLQIHDSIVCECRTEDADRVEKRLVEAMESVKVLDVPVVAEPKRGNNLSQL